jgi:hypothetical protein
VVSGRLVLASFSIHIHVDRNDAEASLLPIRLYAIPRLQLLQPIRGFRRADGKQGWLAVKDRQCVHAAS